LSEASLFTDTCLPWEVDKIDSLRELKNNTKSIIIVLIKELP